MENVLREIQDDPTRVDAVDGEVRLTGPDGTTFSLTPAAAAQTAERLLAGAAEAEGQKILSDNDDLIRKARLSGGAVK